MRFSSITVLSLTALAAAAPTPKKRQAGPVLADTTFDAISISGGQAGNAEQEALDVFSALDLNNPENIDPADIDFLGEVNNVANDAETDAFNPAIEAATGAEADALEAGKTKNKVLKLMATKIELEAKQAQGEDVAAKLEEELTKLNNNIATDVENAGNPSTAVAFDATISGGGNVAAGAGAANANNNAAAGNAVDDAEADASADGAEANADDAEANADDAEANADDAEANADDAATDDTADDAAADDTAADDEAADNTDDSDSNDNADDEDDDN